jgi:protein-tyrosine phosphatase
MDQVTEFVCFVYEQRKAQHPVAVHCVEGLGRTGTMLAVYLIAQGHSADAAILRIRKVEKLAIQTSHQVRFLEEFGQRIRRPSGLSLGTNE